MLKRNNFQSKITISIVLSIFMIAFLAICTVYYWSFYHFSKIFEDRVIDERTFQAKKDMGVLNEWILGVTTHSIDVVESIHGDKVASQILKQSESQVEPEKLYKDIIDGKHLIYAIRLETDNGETIYTYSIIKDIYAEVFPQIVLSFVIFILLILIIFLWYTRQIGQKFTNDIAYLRSYIQNFHHLPHSPTQKNKAKDNQFNNLIEDLNALKATINHEEAMRRATLQYISHELKTPIMIIEGYVASALDGIYPKGDLEASLMTIMDQSRRMEQKVADLLTIVKLESKQLQIASPTEESLILDVKVVLNKVLLSFEKQLEQKSLKLDIAPNLLVEADPDKLTILFENLVTNQIKYSHKKISISGRVIANDLATSTRLASIDKQPANGETSLLKLNASRLVLSFFNDGEAIPPQIKDTLFQPFVMGYNGSTGLGLSICKSIARELDGDISLLEQNGGVVFRVELPLVKLK